MNRPKIFYFWNTSIILKPNALKLDLYWCEACVWKSDAIFFVWLFSSCFFCSRRSVNKTWRNRKQHDGRAKTREDWVASRSSLYASTQTSLVFFSSATVASFPLTLRFTNWTPVTEWFTFYWLIFFLGIDLENISQQAEAIFGGST